MQRSVAAGMVRRNRHAICSRVAMEVPKGHGFRFFADYRAANAQVELVPWAIPDLGAMASRFGGMLTSYSLGYLQDYCQMALAE